MSIIILLAVAWIGLQVYGSMVMTHLSEIAADNINKTLSQAELDDIKGRCDVSEIFPGGAITYRYNKVYLRIDTNNKLIKFRRR